jgi:hypothetical protein
MKLFSNTKIIEDLVEEVVDEGFAGDAHLTPNPPSPLYKGELWNYP